MNEAFACVVGKKPPTGEVIRIDEILIKDDLNKVVVSINELTLKALQEHGVRPRLRQQTL